MRILLPIIAIVWSARGTAPLDEMTLLAFVSVECIAEPGSERTTLPGIIRPLAYKRLLPWFNLDEESFVDRAREIVHGVHTSVLEIKEEEGMFLRNVEPLRQEGLNDEQILDALTRKYFRSLRNITVLKDLAAKRKYGSS
jgi:hypothetical protein